MTAETKRYVEVALPLPVRKTFTYEVPEELGAVVSPGKRVLVPFGRRVLTGFVLGPAKTIPSHTAILPIRQALDEEISLPEKSLRLLIWASQYYLEPIGEVIQTAFPAGVNVRSKETFRLTAGGKKPWPVLSPILGKDKSCGNSWGGREKRPLSLSWERDIPPFGPFWRR